MSDNPIVMVDYGGSNIRSVQKAFEAIGAAVAVTADPDAVRAANRLVLPGVGAFGASIDALRTSSLDGAIIEAAGRGAWLLGICLGMQLLLDESEELGEHAGLGLLPGRVVPFDGRGLDGQPALKIPHVGWNEIAHDGRSPLLAGIPSGAYAYFVHSYHCVPDDPGLILATTGYGHPFPSVIGQGRIAGIQFHPEKSQRIGLGILRNFASLEED